MGRLSRAVFVKDAPVQGDSSATQMVVAVSDIVKARMKWLKGMAGKPGRPSHGHSYNDSLGRVFVFLDAVGWQPCADGFGVDIWWGDLKPEEAYGLLIEGVEGKLGRELTIAEYVMFAQWKGYGREDLKKYGWLTGKWFEMVKENLETAEADFAGEEVVGEPAVEAVPEQA